MCCVCVGLGSYLDVVLTKCGLGVVGGGMEPDLNAVALLCGVHWFHRTWFGPGVPLHAI